MFPRNGITNGLFVFHIGIGYGLCLYYSISISSCQVRLVRDLNEHCWHCVVRFFKSVCTAISCLEPHSHLTVNLHRCCFLRSSRKAPVIVHLPKTSPIISSYLFFSLGILFFHILFIWLYYTICSQYDFKKHLQPSKLILPQPL